MDRNPGTQGNNPPKPNTDLANDTPVEQASTQTTTVVETVTTKTEEPVVADHTTDASRPMATEVVTETVTETNANQPVAQPAKKKSRKGLVALIVTLLIIILAAAGLAVWYFAFYSKPEKVVFDAIDGFLKQETVVSEGLVNGEINFGNNKFLITAGLDSKAAGISSESTADLKLSILDENGELLSDYQYELEASSIIMKDGIIYFRIGKLLEAFDALLEESSVSSEDLDTDMLAVYETIEEIDGEWWQVNIPDIIDEVVGDPEEAAASKDFYACLIDVANSESVKKDLIAAYDKNQFLKIEKTTAQGNLTDYDVSLNYEKLAAFLNMTDDSETARSIENCARKLDGFTEAGNNTDDKPITAADLEADFGNLEALTLTISNFGHELKGVSYKISNDDEAEFTGGFEFEHPAVTVEAPESYRPVNELVEQIVAMASGLFEINGELDEDYPNYEFDETTDGYYPAEWGNDAAEI